MGGQVRSDPAAFDRIAYDYDISFSHSAVGRLLRARVWRHLERWFEPGQTVLDLGCGTGEDACWLADRGLSVTAIDGSSEMVRIAAEKASRSDLSENVKFEHLSFEDFIEDPYRTITGESSVEGRQREVSIGSGNNGQLFDGVLSNFGGLNILQDWQPLARAISRIIRPGGTVILVPMGRICPWEIGWYLIHLKARSAFRRFAARPTAIVGDKEIALGYPSPERLVSDHQPWFLRLYVESLGLLLPPSYLNSMVERRPALFRKLNDIELRLARKTRGWGDHFILALRRI